MGTTSPISPEFRGKPEQADLGATLAQGRPWVRATVIDAPDEEPGGVLVGTAYEPTGKAKRAYRRRRRRRPR